MHEVVAAFLVSDGRVLLGHRAATRRWYPDVWDAVGGHVDAGEAPGQALQRELQEELGVEVDSDLGEPLAHVVDPESQGGGLDIQFWRISAWAGEIINCAPDEQDELRWFSREELPELRLAHPRLVDLLERVLGDG